MKTLRSWQFTIRRGGLGWCWFLVDGEECIAQGTERFYIDARRAAAQAQFAYSVIVAQADAAIRKRSPDNSA